MKDLYQCSNCGRLSTIRSSFDCIDGKKLLCDIECFEQYLREKKQHQRGITHANN